MRAYVKWLSVLAAVLVSAPADAQQAGPLSPARVTLIANGSTPVSTPRDGRTEVFRQARRSPQNVVIVDRNASADDLAAALAMLNALRLQYGDSLSHDLRARAERVRHGAQWEGSAYRKWLQEQLARLRRAPDRALEPFGTVKAVQITLPPPNGKISNPRANEQ